jgi:Ca-dependent carbohydrate-binding module xylan-binding
MNQETLKFVVTLSATFWERRPQFSIWFDDHVVQQSEISATSSHTVTFNRTVDQGLHAVKIRLENKTDSDTVLENGSIIKDMALNIEDITINDTSLGNLLWSAEYLLDKPQEYQGKTIDHLDHCVNLGWNGTYILKFSSPFYIWLLEKL